MLRASPLVAFAVVAAGCLSGAPTPTADVVATFYPLAFLATAIAGPNLTVATAVPAGVEPHDWEPGPGDIRKIASAKILLTQGAGFEPWLTGILSNVGSGGPTVVDSTAGLALRDGEDEGEVVKDPHTWLDPVLFAEQATRVETALAAAFPSEAPGIRARAAALRAELSTLHEAFLAGLRTCEARVIVANHDAYGYLAARYAFDVEAITGLSPEAEPSQADLARVVEVARKHNLTIIFFEELVDPRVAEVVAREVGASTRVLSPIETAPDGGYLAGQRANLANLRAAMRCAV